MERHSQLWITDDRESNIAPQAQALAQAGDHGVVVRIRLCESRGMGANPIGPPVFVRGSSENEGCPGVVELAERSRASATAHSRPEPRPGKPGFSIQYSVFRRPRLRSLAVGNDRCAPTLPCCEARVVFKASCRMGLSTCECRIGWRTRSVREFSTVRDRCRANSATQQVNPLRQGRGEDP